MSKDAAPIPSDVRRLRLVSVTTTAASGVHLQRGQLSYLRKQGIEVIAISSPGPELQQLGDREGVDVIPVPMAREIRPLQDLISLFRLWCVLRQLRPDVVNAGTPKAGLIGMVAAWLAGVPVRLYTQRGLRLETCHGFKAWLLSWTERIACHCAHRVIFVSPSLRSACLQRKLIRGDKAIVIGSGSSNGVDIERFRNLEESAEIDELRNQLGIPLGVPVIGFVGRMTRDKGIEELCEVFKRVQQNHPTARLLLVGDYESGDPVGPSTRLQLAANPNVIITGFVEDVCWYYRLMTVLAFPSHREGFPNVPLEAACTGIPSVGFQATGTVDAIAHGQTGIVVPVHDVVAFADAIETYLSNPSLQKAHGQAGRHRAISEFSPHRVWGELLSLYQQQVLERRGYRPTARSSGIAVSTSSRPEESDPLSSQRKAA